MDKLEKFVIAFLDEHWHKFNTEDLGLPKSKDEFIESMECNKTNVGWVITEAMTWILDRNYLKPYIVEDDDALIIKVDESYTDMRAMIFLKKYSLKLKQ